MELTSFRGLISGIIMYIATKDTQPSGSIVMNHDENLL